jgi:hypothetical protein
MINEGGVAEVVVVPTMIGLEAVAATGMMCECDEDGAGCHVAEPAIGRHVRGRGMLANLPALCAAPLNCSPVRRIGSDTTRPTRKRGGAQAATPRRSICICSCTNDGRVAAELRR